MSGWEVSYQRRCRFYPARFPWGTRRVTYYVAGGGFVYGAQ